MSAPFTAHYCLLKFPMTYGRMPPWLKYASSTYTYTPLISSHIIKAFENWVFNFTYLSVKVDCASERLSIVGSNGNILSRSYLLYICREVNRVEFVTRQSQWVCIFTGLKTQRNDSHFNQVASVNPLKTLCYHNFNALENPNLVCLS